MRRVRVGVSCFLGHHSAADAACRIFVLEVRLCI
jgi:hypothetical protein